MVKAGVEKADLDYKRPIPCNSLTRVSASTSARSRGRIARHENRLQAPVDVSGHGPLLVRADSAGRGRGSNSGGDRGLRFRAKYEPDWEWSVVADLTSGRIVGMDSYPAIVFTPEQTRETVITFRSSCRPTRLAEIGRRIGPAWIPMWKRSLSAW